MITILKEAYSQKHKRRGRHAKLSVEEMLLLALEYSRQYITFSELGFNYGVAESTAHDITVWVENVLVKGENFSLHGKKALLDENELEIILVDVTESPIERPKKQQKYYSGKKKKHTIKTQLIVNANSGKIICTAHDFGRCHDFKLF